MRHNLFRELTLALYCCLLTDKQECTSLDELPHTRAEYLGTNVTCDSPGNERVASYITIGTWCGDPGDMFLYSNDAVFECATENYYELITDDFLFTCVSEISVPRMSGDASFHLPPAKAETDFRFASVNDICYTYRPSSNATTTISISKQAEMPEKKTLTPSKDAPLGIEHSSRAPLKLVSPGGFGIAVNFLVGLLAVAF